MKQNAVEFADRYVAAVRRFLRRGTGASMKPAFRIGERAVVLGLETLEMARIHEQSLIALKVPVALRGSLRRAESFFSEAIIPIIETHSAAVQSRSDLGRLNETLTRRTLELALSHRRLRAGIARRKVVEAALKTSGEHYARLLKESLQLQSELRRLTHKVLAAQEDERLNISRKLKNEIGQTLLGINVRLAAMKQETGRSTKGFRSEITHTQRLVAKSAKSMSRVAQSLRPT